MHWAPCVQHHRALDQGFRILTGRSDDPCETTHRCCPDRKSVCDGHGLCGSGANSPFGTFGGSFTGRGAQELFTLHEASGLKTHCSTKSQSPRPLSKTSSACLVHKPCSLPALLSPTIVSDAHSQCANAVSPPFPNAQPKASVGPGRMPRGPPGKTSRLEAKDKMPAHLTNADDDRRQTPKPKPQLPDLQSVLHKSLPTPLPISASHEMSPASLATGSARP